MMTSFVLDVRKRILRSNLFWVWEISPCPVTCFAHCWMLSSECCVAAPPAALRQMPSIPLLSVAFHIPSTVGSFLLILSSLLSFSFGWAVKTSRCDPAHECFLLLRRGKQGEPLSIFLRGSKVVSWYEQDSTHFCAMALGSRVSSTAGVHSFLFLYIFFKYHYKLQFQCCLKHFHCSGITKD